MKRLEVVLAVTGHTEFQVKKIVKPLKELHDLRITARAHGGPKGRAVVAKNARKDFEKLRLHFRDLVSRLDKGMKSIINDLFEN